MHLPSVPSALPVGKKEADWVNLQRDLATFSTMATFVESQGDHFVHLSDTQTVAAAIAAFFQKHFSPESTSK